MAGGGDGERPRAELLEAEAFVEFAVIRKSIQGVFVDHEQVFLQPLILLLGEVGKDRVFDGF